MNAKKANYTYEKAQQLQRKLYLAAKTSNKRRFHALFDKVKRKDILYMAWNKVKSNKGVAGIDNITIQQIENIGVDKLIEEIQHKLTKGKYKPKPVKRVYIDKKDGSKRPLGIPTVIDRVIQMATKIVIEPIFEADFKNCSYGFRPKRKAHQVLEKIRVHANNKGWYVLDADIKGYFDNINHEKLLILVKQRISDKRIIKLIRKWLKAGVMEEEKYFNTTVGTPQGGVISPLLSNIYLNYLDTLWERHYERYGTLYRFADDFIVISQTRKEITNAYKAIKYIMNKLELTLHPIKTKIVNLWEGKEGFDFLGFHHRSLLINKDGKRKYHSMHQWPTNKAIKKMYQKIKKEIGTPSSISQDLEDLIKILNRKIIGWRNYYGLKRARNTLNKVDNYIILRFTIWWNRKRQKRHRLSEMTKIRRILRDKGLKSVVYYG